MGGPGKFRATQRWGQIVHGQLSVSPTVPGCFRYGAAVMPVTSWIVRTPQSLLKQSATSVMAALTALKHNSKLNPQGRPLAAFSSRPGDKPVRTPLCGQMTGEVGGCLLTSVVSRTTAGSSSG